MTKRRIVNDITTPADHPVTANELKWIEFIRIISGDTDPTVTSEAVQVLQKYFRGRGLGE